MKYQPGCSEPSFIHIRELLSRIVCDFIQCPRETKTEIKNMKIYFPKEFVFTINDSYD